MNQDGVFGDDDQFRRVFFTLLYRMFAENGMMDCALSVAKAQALCSEEDMKALGIEEYDSHRHLFESFYIHSNLRMIREAGLDDTANFDRVTEKARQFCLNPPSILDYNITDGCPTSCTAGQVFSDDGFAAVSASNQSQVDTSAMGQLSLHDACQAALDMPPPPLPTPTSRLTQKHIFQPPAKPFKTKRLSSGAPPHMPQAQIPHMTQSQVLYMPKKHSLPPDTMNVDEGYSAHAHAKPKQPAKKQRKNDANQDNRSVLAVQGTTPSPPESATDSGQAKYYSLADLPRDEEGAVDASKLDPKAIEHVPCITDRLSLFERYYRYRLRIASKEPSDVSYDGVAITVSQLRDSMKIPTATDTQEVVVV